MVNFTAVPGPSADFSKAPGTMGWGQCYVQVNFNMSNFSSGRSVGDLIMNRTLFSTILFGKNCRFSDYEQ